jgi:hypothetical protein
MAFPLIFSNWNTSAAKQPYVLECKGIGIGKVVLVHAMKTYTGSAGIAPFFLNLGSGR